MMRHLEHEISETERAMLAGLGAVEERLLARMAAAQAEVVRFQAEREDRFAEYLDRLLGITDLFRAEIAELRRDF